MRREPVMQDRCDMLVKPRRMVNEIVQDVVLLALREPLFEFPHQFLPDRREPLNGIRIVERFKPVGKSVQLPRDIAQRPFDFGGRKTFRKAFFFRRLDRQAGHAKDKRIGRSGDLGPFRRQRRFVMPPVSDGRSAICLGHRCPELLLERLPVGSISSVEGGVLVARTHHQIVLVPAELTRGQALRLGHASRIRAQRLDPLGPHLRLLGLLCLALPLIFAMFFFHLLHLRRGCGIEKLVQPVRKLFTVATNSAEFAEPIFRPVVLAIEGEGARKRDQTVIQQLPRRDPLDDSIEIFTGEPPERMQEGNLPVVCQRFPVLALKKGAALGNAAPVERVVEFLPARHIGVELFAVFVDVALPPETQRRHIAQDCERLRSERRR